MTETAHSGGLAGFGRRLFSFNSEDIALKLVFFAGVITIVQKAGIEIPYYATWFGVSLGIAALLYEMGAAKSFARAWFYAKPGALAAAATLWVCALGYSVNNWMGAASQSQVEKSNLHKEALFATQDTRKDADATERLYKQAMEDRSKLTPKRSAAEARAVIDSAQAHKLWRYTDACKDTKGRQSRDFCDNYRSAVADVGLWDAISVQDVTVEKRKAAWDEARKVATSTKVEISEGRPDLLLLTKYAGMTEESANIFNSLGSILCVSIFLSFGSMRAELERLSATGRRQRFNFLLALRRGYYRIVHGTEPPNVTINHIGTLDGLTKADLAARVRDAQMTAASRLAAA